jgi:hypothetical protein
LYCSEIEKEAGECGFVQDGTGIHRFQNFDKIRRDYDVTLPASSKKAFNNLARKQSPKGSVIKT